MTKDHESDEAEADAFARAMAEENVVPLSSDSRRHVRPTSPVSLPPIATAAAARNAPSATDPESDADFAADGVDRRDLMKLKRGGYAAADRCDLHGLTADAASARVKQFLDSSRQARHRCVCIVHGRGLRSPGGVSVLKVRVRADLRAQPAVLAYADAPRSDGGAGAVYVLLRRR